MSVILGGARELVHMRSWMQAIPRQRTTATCLISLMLALFFLTSPSLPEQGMLILTVMDLGHHPFQGVRMGIEGDGGTPQFSDPSGRVRYKLAPETQPKTWVTLMVVQSPGVMDLAIVSPYDRRAQVPSFENESQNYVPVYLARRSDLRILETGAGILALHGTINRSVASRRANRSGTVFRKRSETAAVKARRETALVRFSRTETGTHEQENTDKELYKAALAEASNKFGLAPEKIEAAFLNWGGDPLTWKIVDLSGMLDTGGTNPFETVRSLGVFHDIWFGVAGWDLRVSTLQRLLLSFRARDSARFDSIAGNDKNWLIDILEAPSSKFYKSASARMLDSSGKLIEPWKSRLIALAQEPIFQRVQVEELVPPIQRAQQKASELGLGSERAVAFLYDLVNQYGFGGTLRRAYKDYEADTAAFAAKMGRQPDEVERLLFLANRTSSHSFSPGPIDRLSRERVMMIALGGGRFLNREYDLDALGIGLRSYATGEAIPVHNDQAILDMLKSGWLPAGSTGTL